MIPNKMNVVAPSTHPVT